MDHKGRTLSGRGETRDGGRLVVDILAADSVRTKANDSHAFSYCSHWQIPKKRFCTPFSLLLEISGHMILVYREQAGRFPAASL